MSQFNDEEKDLYEQSRALKFKARELRKLRLEKEAKIQAAAEKVKAAAKAAVDIKAREAKADRDNRIRKALLAMADAAKTNGLAFDAPWGFYGTSPAQHAFYLIDKKAGGKIEIKTHPTGFSWD